MWNYLYLGACLAFTILLLIIFHSKKRINSVENKLFRILVNVSVISITSELILQYLTITFGATNQYMILFSKLYLVSIILWFTFFSKYVFYIMMKKDTKNSDEKKLEEIMKKYITIKNIYNIVFVVFSIVLMILPIKYYINGNSMYSYGKAVDFLRVSLLLFMATWIILLIKNHKYALQAKYLPIYAIIILLFLNIFLQKINPSLLIISFTFSFLCYLMFFTIENPDLKVIEQLNMAKNQAERANKAKTDFLSSMSHEIRTPLNAIVGFSELINESDDIDEAKENATDVINASSTLLEIVNSILDISKIESGKIEIVDSPYKARDTFEQLAKLITPRMNEKELVFNYKIADDLPEILYGDHANVKKVVTNLLSNAVKYTDAGFVNYEVNCIITNDICKLIISVEDSGRGIKKEKIDKLFQKFERFDTDRNTTIEGTGLGLAITKNLVELMGGKIIVHTVYGEGSKFTIVLDQKISKEPIIEEKKVNDKLDLKGKKILIVDDNEMNRKVAKKLFEKSGCEDIVLASSGYECLEELENRRDFDVILLDDMMPKMSGTITLKKIKERKIEIPVVALTANALTGMKESYLESGFDDYISKPMEKKEVATVLNKIFEKRAPKKSLEDQENSQAEKALKEVEKEEKKIDDNFLEPVKTGKEEELLEPPKMEEKEVAEEVVEETQPVEAPKEEEIPAEEQEELTPVETESEEKPSIVETEELTPVEETEELAPAETEELTPVETEELTPAEETEELTPVETEELTPVEETEELKPVEEEHMENNEEILEPSNNTVEIHVEEPPTMSLEEYMRGRGVDMDASLELLGDMGMYEDTLKDFKDSLAEKWSKIEQYKLNQDMKNYAIEVHSLKSDCKYLGFMDLANVAYEHEMKSKENDVDFVNNNFDRLSEEYTKLLNILDGYSF